MRRLLSFMVMTLDGYHEGPNHEFDWPNVDDEFNEFALSQLNDIDTLLFGRATYEGMASYWPSPAAQEGDPLVAGFMNSVPKIVFSTTLPSAEWENTTLVSRDVATAISELKAQPGKSLAIFGSSNLTVSLLERCFVDELRVMVMPILLGAGNSLFAGLKDGLHLKLTRTTTFSSGNVLLHYHPGEGTRR